MKLRVLFASALAPLVVLACSGAAATDLFAARDNAGTTEPEPLEPGADETPAPSPSSTSSGPTTPKKDAGATTKKDAGTAPSDSGPPPPPAETIVCGSVNGTTTTCEVGSQVCCATFTDFNKATFQCKPASGTPPCGGAVKIACDDRADCPADQICCGMLVQGSGYTSVECRSSCNSSPGVLAVHFCDPEAAVDECIGYGGVCIKSQSVPGMYVCGPA